MTDGGGGFGLSGSCGNALSLSGTDIPKAIDALLSPGSAPCKGQYNMNTLNCKTSKGKEMEGYEAGSNGNGSY